MRWPKRHRAAAKSTAVERALIAALAKRYADPQPEDRKPLDEAYRGRDAQGLAGITRDDADVGALFAESMMDLRPWDLWTADGQPQPGTEEIVATLEAVLAQIARSSAGAAPLYPRRRGLAQSGKGRRRRPTGCANLQPGLGHLVHMPSHIDVRRGRWAQAIVDQRQGDRRRPPLPRASRPSKSFYRVYMAHNHHMLAYCGHDVRPEQAGDRRRSTTWPRGCPPSGSRKTPPLADGFTAMPLEVLVRFGRWDEVLAAPEPPEYLPIARALRHCARGIAYAAKGDIASAKAEQQRFCRSQRQDPRRSGLRQQHGRDLMTRRRAPAGRRDSVSRRQDRAGARRAARGRSRRGHAPVLRAARLDSSRRATPSAPRCWTRAEPPKPRRSIARTWSSYPNNGWSLYGLAKSLALQGKNAEAADGRNAVRTKSGKTPTSKSARRASACRASRSGWLIRRSDPIILKRNNL